MESVQYYMYQLPSPVYSVGGTWTQPMQQLPKQIFGRIAHLSSILINGTFTPTFTTQPTVYGNQNIITRCDFYDGQTLRFQGGFNVLRQKERLHSGGTRLADTDQNITSAGARFITHIIHLGPPNMSGYPSDYVLPVGMLQSGELRFNYGNLPDLSADTTALTASFRIVCKLVLLDELRIPPIYQFQYQSFNAQDFIVSGRALYTEMAIVPPSNPQFSGTQTFAAGDLNNITLDMGEGNLINTIRAQDLWQSYNDDFGRGDLLGLQGEPAGANDVNGKTVNHSSPTAIAPTAADLQPVLWVPPDGRISKCFAAQSQARLRWDGSKTSGQVLFGRHLSQPPTLVAQNIQRALAGTGQSLKSFAVRTLSKKPYPDDGPFREFMPWKVKLS